MFWLFGLNVMVCGFMQFRYTINGGDTAVAILSLIIFISLPICSLILRVKYYDPDDATDVENYKLIHEGLKEGRYHYMPWVYMLRRVIFAVIVAGSVGGGSRGQAIGFMLVSIVMFLLLLIIRPYQ